MIYLASSSPRRRALLKKAGIRFKVFCPTYEETNDARVSVRMLVKRHALGKAISASSRIRDGLVLGADTVVVRHGSLSGKPRNMQHAERMLQNLQGKWHTVLTGVALLKIRAGKVVKKTVFVESTAVKLKKLSAEQRKRYLKRIGPLDKAGAYAIQSKAIDIVPPPVRSGRKATGRSCGRTGGGIVERVRGSLANAMGLPMEKLKKKLGMLR